MSDTESFESVARSYDDCTWIGRDGVKRAIDRLKAAHEREMEELRKTYDLALAQARDPQRLLGTKPDTFDGAIEALREFRWQHATNDEDAIPYVNAVKEMHIREIRNTAQREYHRGYESGRHSMDAEHAAVAMRLRGLRFDGGSHENLSSIAYAIYPCATGWTCESSAGLRDKLIELMGGVSDGPADDCRIDSDSGDSGRGFHFDELSVEKRIEKLVKQRDRARAEVINLRDAYFKMQRRLEQERDELQAKLDAYERADTAESIVRELRLGSITDAQAIERIDALRGAE